LLGTGWFQEQIRA